MKKVIILLGPTGVGKTGASILLAKKLDTEIISADSMQIYRHMDIGTAKPSFEERTVVRHHMIDIVEPYEYFSTGRYREMAGAIIQALHEKGKIPLVVGGTGLYIRAMTRGIFSGPSADWTLREELLSTEREVKGTLYNYLKNLDPAAAQKITVNDTRRIIRALEVCLKSPVNISSMQDRFTRPLPFDFIKIGLTRERKELYRMIEERVDLMINAGFINEVTNVKRIILNSAPVSSSGETGHSLSSIKAIGYKEIAQHISGEISLEEAVRLVKRNTKRYAKRQFTWFRKEEGIHWIDITGIFDDTTIIDRILTKIDMQNA
jgi:tRNA dimethylallyltransferase